MIERPKSPLRVILRAIRVHQWVKNLLIFVPIMTAHKVFDLHMLALGTMAFLMFSFVASSHYLVNDLLDLSSDRQHLKKRSRPLASGALSIPAGIALSLLLIVMAFLVSITLTSVAFSLWLLGYFILTNLYSFLLKQRLLVDLIALSCLYTIRIMAGGAITGIHVSEWLLAFSMFFFSSLAFAKRFTELKEMLAGDKRGRLRGRAYQLDDLDLVRVMGPVSGFIAILVIALYINSPTTLSLYHRPQFLWAVCPLLAYWIMRIWFLANRGELHYDPVVFALRDRNSYIVGAWLLMAMLVAKF